jgi:hypothetical protein
VVEKRAAALRKIGVNVGSNEMRRKIVSGRIFYNEHGLYTELVDQNGNIVKNRIGDGPVGSMSGTSKRVITADFGDGPNEYAISSSARRENGDGENVSLVRIAGDDELSVSSLIGREILNGDDRNALPKLNGVLLGGAEGDRVLLDDGRQSPILSRRLTDDSLVTTPLRESLRDTTRLKSLVTQATEKKLDKLDGDVEISEKRVEGLEQALRHFDETGEWLGEDFGVSGSPTKTCSTNSYSSEA